MNLLIGDNGAGKTSVLEGIAVALGDTAFIMLEKGTKAEITDIFLNNGMTPKPKFTTFDDYAVMSMVEKGLGIAILPKLILQRTAYRIAVKPLDVKAYRTIGTVMRNRKELSPAADRFLKYLEKYLADKKSGSNNFETKLK